MLKYSVARSHCLVTTLQLLAMWQAAEADPSRAQEFRRALFETEGRLAGFADWKDIVAVVDDEVAEDDGAN
jgi:hypothetical protein